MPSPWYPIKEICSHLTLEETEDQREYDLEGHEVIKFMLPQVSEPGLGPGSSFPYS